MTSKSWVGSAQALMQSHSEHHVHVWRVPAVLEYSECYGLFVIRITALDEI